MPESELITEEALMSSSNVDVYTAGEIGDETIQYLQKINFILI